MLFIHLNVNNASLCNRCSLIGNNPYAFSVWDIWSYLGYNHTWCVGDDDGGDDGEDNGDEDNGDDEDERKQIVIWVAS